jgi:hypothetical protein
MLNRSMTICDAILALRSEVDSKMHLLAELEKVFNEDVTAEANPAVAAVSKKKTSNYGIGYEAAKILREAGRPMHAMREIHPALAAKGIKCAKAGLATSMTRSGLCQRVGRGLFAHIEGGVEEGHQDK